MSQVVKDFFTTYSDFVTKVTSEPSLDMDALKKSMDEIESSSDVKIPRLLTAALGLGSGTIVELMNDFQQKKREKSQFRMYVCLSFGGEKRKTGKKGAEERITRFSERLVYLQVAPHFSASLGKGHLKTRPLRVQSAMLL